jgi:hypothetical protein
MTEQIGVYRFDSARMLHYGFVPLLPVGSGKTLPLLHIKIPTELEEGDGVEGNGQTTVCPGVILIVTAHALV